MRRAPRCGYNAGHDSAPSSAGEHAAALAMHALPDSSAGIAMMVLFNVGAAALMVNLAIETWIRFVVWLVIGLGIYFFYGRTHSNLARANRDSSVRAEGSPAS